MKIMLAELGVKDSSQIFCETCYPDLTPILRVINSVSLYSLEES